MVDEYVEDLLKDDQVKDKKFRLTSARRKKVLVFIIPIFIFISIIGVVISSIFNLCIVNGLSIILVIITSVWFLAYLRINWKIPVNMITNQDKLTIEFVFPFQDITFTWKDIKDIKMFDHILLDSGKKIILKQVMKDEWDLIYESLMESNTLVDDENGKLDEDLLNIIKKKGKEPTENYVIEGISVGYLLQYLLLGALSVLLVFLGPAGLVIGFMRGDRGITQYGFLFCAFAPVGIGVSIFMVRRILKRKRVHIGHDGIRCLIGKNVNLIFPWNDIQNCYTREELNGSMEVLGVRSKKGLKYEINSHEVPLKRMKEGFSLIKDFCAFHDIEINNDLAW